MEKGKKLGALAFVLAAIVVATFVAAEVQSKSVTDEVALNGSNWTRVVEFPWNGSNSTNMTESIFSRK